MIPAGLAVLAFSFTFVSGIVRGSLRGPFRIDEAHKISETAFAKLAAAGDFDHPAWRDHIIDRTNPPVGKFYLGSFIGLSGEELPDPPTLSLAAEPDGFLNANFPERATSRFAPLLPVARFASLVATSVGAAVVGWSVATAAGAFAAALVVALFATSFLVIGYGSTATFDPLHAMLIACGALPVLAGTRLQLRSAVALGVVSALAFQTRSSGLVSLLAGIVAVAATSRAAMPRLRRWIVVSVASFVPVSIAINPFYWSPLDAGSLDPRRWSFRIAMQMRDLDTLLSMLERRGHVIRTIGEKLDFLFQNLFGDLSGLLLLVGMILFAASIIRVRTWSMETRSLVVWAASVLVAMILWLPVAWPRYLLTLLAPAAILGGLGWNEAVKVLRLRMRSENPEQPRGR